MKGNEASEGYVSILTSAAICFFCNSTASSAEVTS